MWELTRWCNWGARARVLESFRQLFRGDLYRSKRHPGQHVDFCGELLLKVACKRHLNPHDHADPSGFGCCTEHGAETMRQPPWLIGLVQDLVSRTSEVSTVRWHCRACGKVWERAWALRAISEMSHPPAGPMHSCSRMGRRRRALGLVCEGVQTVGSLLQR